MRRNFFKTALTPFKDETYNFERPNSLPVVKKVFNGIKSNMGKKYIEMESRQEEFVI